MQLIFQLGIATQDGTIKVDDLVRPFRNDNAFSFIGTYTAKNRFVGTYAFTCFISG